MSVCMNVSYLMLQKLPAWLSLDVATGWLQYKFHFHLPPPASVYNNK